MKHIFGVLLQAHTDSPVLKNIEDGWKAGNLQR